MNTHINNPSFEKARPLFLGVERLWGIEKLKTLFETRVLIVGVGGVGSWCVEALARTGVGHIGLLDGDDICLSNINRQLPALHSTVGQMKCDALEKRLKDINPYVSVEKHIDFFTNTSDSLKLLENYDIVIDAMDDYKAKEYLYQSMLDNNIYQKLCAFISCGGAGHRSDPSLLKYAKLEKTYQDPLLRNLRKHFQKTLKPSQYRRLNQRIKIVFTSERMKSIDVRDASLNCHGALGSYMPVTSQMGLMAADLAIKSIVGNNK